jgi:hypothetical protein
MPRKLKVYGWTGWRQECPPARNGGKQTREICAAPSMAAVARILGIKNPRTLDMCTTGNVAELEKALANPGVVFWSPLDQRDERTWTRAESADK